MAFPIQIVVDVFSANVELFGTSFGADCFDNDRYVGSSSYSELTEPSPSDFLEAKLVVSRVFVLMVTFCSGPTGTTRTRPFSAIRGNISRWNFYTVFFTVKKKLYVEPI